MEALQLCSYSSSITDTFQIKVHSADFREDKILEKCHNKSIRQQGNKVSTNIQK